MSKPIGIGPSFPRLVVRVIEKPVVQPAPAVIKCQPVKGCNDPCLSKPERKPLRKVIRINKMGDF